MKITKLTTLLLVVFSLIVVLAFVGCNDNGAANGAGTSFQDACEHADTFVNNDCEEVCAVCAKVISTGVHDDLTVTIKCQEVCSRCGEVFRSDVHGETMINADCERFCVDCGKVVETDVHGDKIINANCEEICARCGKVYQTGMHDQGQHNDACEVNCIKCGELLATESHGDTVINDACEEVCARCGKVMATGVHGEKVVNDQLQEVCANCGVVYTECVHDEGVVENCVRSCGNCGEIIETEVHGDKIVNDKCEEVCADCGKVYQTGIHAKGIECVDCVIRCSRCNKTLETEAHAEKIITDKCEEVCSRCGKVYNTGVHAESVLTYTDDAVTNIRTYFKACKRCGGDVVESSVYTVQLGASKPQAIVSTIELANMSLGAKFNKTVLSADQTYVTISGKANQSDVFFYPYIGDGSVTGRYMVIKYRTSAEKIGKWEFFVSAGRGKTSAAGGENFYYKPVANGEWQVVVLDLAKLQSKSVVPNADGTYSVDYIRWDIFNDKLATDTTVDVATIAFADSVDKLSSMYADAASVTVVLAENKSYEVYPESGTPSGADGTVIGYAKPFYKFNIDNACSNTAAKAGADKTFMTSVTKLNTIGGKFTIYGWAGAYADIEKYQYSLDGGYSWNDFTGGSTISNETGVVNVLKGAYAGYGNVTSIANCRFKDLACDLSAYYGQTVSVTFGAKLVNGDRIPFIEYLNVNVTNCSHYIIAEEDYQPNGPQGEVAECSICGELFYRGYTSTSDGLTVFSPDALLECGTNGQFNFTTMVENGMSFYRATAKAAKECSITLNRGTTALTGVGRYAAALVRINKGNTPVDMWMNKAGRTDEKDENGKVSAKNVFQYGKVGQWTLLIYDYNGMANKTDGNGWTRYDILNNDSKSVTIGDNADIAFIAFFDTTDDIYAYYNEYVKAYNGASWCQHVGETTVWNEATKLYDVTCNGCGRQRTEECEHETATVEWNSARKVYTVTCDVCGFENTKDMLYKTEANVDSGNCMTATQKDGYVRYTVDKVSNKDVYTHIYRNGNVVTGKYMVIKYRMVNGGVNPTNRSWFAGTVAGGNTGAAGNGDNSGIVRFNNETTSSGDSFVADGEWHYTIVSATSANTKFVANEDGTYTWAYLRIGFDPKAFDGSCYLDIDEIAFADNLEAVEAYTGNGQAIPEFIVNLDKGNVTLNGSTFLSAAIRKGGTPIAIDMTGKALNAANALQIGGWVCVRGGVQSYKIRVVKENGKAVTNPALTNWATAANRNDIYTAVGSGKGFLSSCATGAGMTKTAIDLSAYAGKTVDFEIVAITNYGYELTVVEVTNVKVPGYFYKSGADLDVVATEGATTSRDSDGYLVVSNGNITDNYVRFINAPGNKEWFAGNYAVIVVKSNNKNSTINKIYTQNSKENAWEDFGNVSIEKYSGWVAIIVDLTAKHPAGSTISVLRVDCCEGNSTLGSRSITFKSVATYATLAEAQAAAEAAVGADNVINK